MLLILIIVALGGCHKRDDKKVTYLVTSDATEVALQYRDRTGLLQKIVLQPAGGQEEWRYSFVAEQGDIVYLSGKYEEGLATLKLMITVDGKVYKQAQSTGDTIRYVTVSGVVPYD
ncbi:MAG: hypothetical protein EOM83_12610 [Clostridia bacterium]|nr:hypothetical protein [Clostridia bacterium]